MSNGRLDIVDALMEAFHSGYTTALDQAGERLGRIAFETPADQEAVAAALAIMRAAQVQVHAQQSLERVMGAKIKPNDRSKR